MAGGVKVGFAAMGLGDLFDEGETGAVGSEAVVFYAGALANAGARGWGVAFDEEDDVTVARKSTGADGEELLTGLLMELAIKKGA